MKPLRLLHVLGGTLIAFSIVACGGKSDATSQVPARSVAATTSSGSSTSDINSLLAKGADLNRAELLRAAQSAPVGSDIGKALAQASSSSRVAAYRFYNSLTGAHFYTVSETEKQSVQDTQPQFLYEGPAFYASGVAAPGLSAVHRFYNRQTGVHFYTISEDEKALVQANLPQFTYEGIAYYASKTAGTELMPLFRFYLSRKGFHFYSSSTSERDNIISTLPQYQFEGVGYYVFGSAPDMSGSKLPHSGITNQQCYQVGSDALVPCSTAGALALNSQQDGHRIGINPMSYSEVPNPAGGTFARTECVRDNVTGLIWEGKTASGLRAGSSTYTNYDSSGRPQKWDGAIFVSPTQSEVDANTNTVGYVRHVNSVALCGYNDWRLPTGDELQGIVNYGAPVLGATLDTGFFPGAVPENTEFWTGQESEFPWRAWKVSFYTGEVLKDERRSARGIRLVRGSGSDVSTCRSVPTLERFTLSGAQVIDKRTGLVWARCSVGQTWDGSTCTGSPTYLRHEEAMILAEQTNGWRLPNVKELASIVSRPCIPAIDDLAFPATPLGGTWTSTPNPTPTSISAWTVEFLDGSVYRSHQSRAGFSTARLVRTSP